MKIAITGKGGVGKSTIAALLSRIFASSGYNVLAVDADPDANLASALGCPKELISKIKPISHLKELIKERMGIKEDSSFFKLNPKVDDLLDRYSVECFENLRLVVMGEVKRGGVGCYCPENTFIKNFFSHILMNQKDVLIMDMEAGIEHLSRGTANFVDAIIIVIEPGRRSIDTAKSIINLANDLNIMNIYLVANKILNKDQNNALRSNIPSSYKIISYINYDPEIILSEERDISLYESSLPIVKEVEKIKEFLERKHI